MKLLFFFTVFFFVSFEYYCQSVQSQKMSGCDTDKRPEIIKDRIIESSFTDGLLKLKVGFSENCSFEPITKLKTREDTLFLSLVHNSQMRAMCNCCFEIELDIQVDKNPEVIMLQKNFFNLNAEFCEIKLSDHWHHDFFMKGITLNKKTEGDSLYLNHFYTSMSDPNKCSEKQNEYEVEKSLLADNIPNVSFLVSDLCKEPIIFAKVILYETDGDNKIGEPIIGDETNFDGEVSFRVNPGLKIVEVKSPEFKPKEFVINVPKDSLFICKTFCSKPHDIEVFNFRSTKQLTQKEFNEIAKRIWLDRGVSDAVVEEYPFILDIY